VQFNGRIDFLKGQAMQPLSNNLGLVPASAAVNALQHSISLWGDLSPEVDKWDAHLRFDPFSSSRVAKESLPLDILLTTGIQYGGIRLPRLTPLMAAVLTSSSLLSRAAIPRFSSSHSENFVMWFL